MLEKRLVSALRDIIQSSDRNDGAALANAIQSARALVETPPDYDSDQASIDNLVTALADLGFGDDDAPVNGGDCVDVICEYWPRLAPLASEWPLPPSFAEIRAQLTVGTRVLSVEGEISDTDQGERSTGPNAIGTITAIDDSIEHGICLAFEPSGVSVLLSCAELADEDAYEIDPETAFPSREALVEAIKGMLAQEGTHALAVRVVDAMIEQGEIEHTERGFVIERDANVFQYAADLRGDDERDPMATEHCTRCGKDLESGQIGECDECQEGPYPADLARMDRLLTADELRIKYGHERAGGEHPRYLRRAWKQEVADDMTNLGYWEWIEAQIEQAQD